MKPSKVGMSLENAYAYVLLGVLKNTRAHQTLNKNPTRGASQEQKALKSKPCNPKP